MNGSFKFIRLKHTELFVLLSCKFPHGAESVQYKTIGLIRRSGRRRRRKNSSVYCSCSVLRIVAVLSQGFKGLTTTSSHICLQEHLAQFYHTARMAKTLLEKNHHNILKPHTKMFLFPESKQTIEMLESLH